MGNVDKFVALSLIELFITFSNHTGLYRFCEQNLQKRFRLDWEDLGLVCRLRIAKKRNKSVIVTAMFDKAM